MFTKLRGGGEEVEMTLPGSDELSEQVDIFPGHDLRAEVIAHKPVLVIARYVGVELSLIHI